jgi:hypothetical protein
MRTDGVTKFLLLLIAVALMVIAIRPVFRPRPAEAQSLSAYPFYIEPGMQMLHDPKGNGGQVYGKVVVDMRNGTIWGFPTGTLDPYPTDAVDNKVQTSHPFVLGYYAFDDTDK